MLNNLLKSIDTIYIAYGTTDFRKHIDSLCEIVRNRFRLNPYTNVAFLFSNKSRRSIRILCYDKNRIYIGGKKIIKKR